MLKNFIRIGWRNAVKNRSNSIISLISLILGLVFFFLITIWVKDELSYDKGFKSAAQICRVETKVILKDGTGSSLPTVGWPVGRFLQSSYPEVESLTYMADWSPIIKFKGSKFYVTAFYGDNNFFNVFGYDLQEGSTSKALSEPFSLVISQSLKKKYFGDSEAIGKVLMINDTIPYKITGVFKDLKEPSHLHFDMIGSFASYCSLRPKDCAFEFASGWYDVNVYNYVKLKNGNTAAAVTAKIQDLVLREGRAAVAATGMKSTLSLRPVSEIYLYSNMPTGAGTSGNIKMVRLFVLIAFFILIIACLNFINLTTAGSLERAKEIGIKKVLGSGKSQLIFQFLTESAVMCLVASAISILIVIFLLPAFNHFTGKSFTLLGLFSVGNLVMFLAIIIVLIPLAGFYPALVLSSYEPIKVLKGTFTHSKSGGLLRKSLVIIQFGISVAFILSTVVIWKQMVFMQTQNLGFDKNKVILVNTNKVPRRLVFNSAQAFKSALKARAGIASTTACAAVPGRTGWDSQFAYPEGRTKDQGSIVEYIPVDNDYVRTIGLTLAAGRNFLPESADDQQNNVLINEAAVRSFGWPGDEAAIGKTLKTSGKDGRVIGVLKDYHQHGLQEQIKPVVLGIDKYARVFAIRYDGRSASQAIGSIKQAWDQIYAGYTFDYKFMDDDFQAQYVKEENFKSLFALAAILSISIASMGLLGLAIFTAKKRTKEIGVRKVLGATVFNILLMLSKDFVKLITLAIVIASPVAWYGMNIWLQGFAYRSAISWWIFPLAGFAAILIALLTISFQAIKAALVNPVSSLKSE